MTRDRAEPGATPRRRWRSLAALAATTLLAGAVPVALRMADAATDFDCSSGYQVDETLTNGARWQLCWERRSFEGIVLHDVTYTPVGGTPVEILGRMNLAQIHVPYDDNGARFHDVSDFGLGFDSTMDDLAAADCPGGTLLADAGRNVLCQTEGPTGYAYKDYDRVGRSTSLNLFSVSHIGAYNYVVAWNLDDDGTIRPEVGATGALQAYDNAGTNATTWPMGGGWRAVAHMHNYYWRLDFDLAGPLDDRVDELEALPAANNTQRRNIRRMFTTEAARRVVPTRFRSWRVRDLRVRNADNHPISVELLPDTDNVFRGPAHERFTHNELYVTRMRTCERFASHNPAPGNRPACRRAPDNQLGSFVNGESLVNRDLIVWYGTSFHHLPRDEDEAHMHPHWSGFSIVPRDLTATNPAP